MSGLIRPTQLLGGVFGGFRDSAPDAWGRLVVAKLLNRSTSQLLEIDFLLHGGAARIGNLDFRKSLDASEPVSAVPLIANLGDLIQASQDLLAHKTVQPELLQVLVQGTSVGGARPKCVIQYQDALWLAKFPATKDTFNNPRVEWATLTLAQKCGLDVAESQIFTLADQRDVLLVKRFDREYSEQGYTRKGFISGLSLLAIDEMQQDAWSYLTIADEIRARGSQVCDLREMYARMAFNVACRNIDDHPRNHGFFVERDSIRLTPAYDLVSQPAIAGVGTDFFLAMQLGTLGRQATVENLLSASPRFGLSMDEAKSILAKIGHETARWREHYSECGIPTEEAEQFSGSFSLATEMRDIHHQDCETSTHESFGEGH
nr:HipA domain-containing protein [Nevskia ramosa]